MTIFRVIFGIFAIIGGGCALLGILGGIWGRRRGPKDNYRDRIPIGPVSSRGFGLLFISVGLMSVLGHAMPKPLGIGLAVCVIAAFFLIIGGLLLDYHAHDVERRAYRLPGEMLTGTPDERQRWIFAACGAALLLMMILALLFCR
jgi:hypothetical protein